MARGPITSPESMKNLKAGGRIRADNQDFAKAVAAAVSEDGPRAAARAVREFARDRPDSHIVRLMFGEPEGDDE